MPPRPELFDEMIVRAEREAEQNAEQLAALRAARDAAARYWAATPGREPARRGRPPVLDTASLRFLGEHPDGAFAPAEVVDGLRRMGVAQDAGNPVVAMALRLGRLYRRGLIARPSPGRYRALPATVPG